MAEWGAPSPNGTSDADATAYRTRSFRLVPGCSRVVEKRRGNDAQAAHESAKTPTRSGAGIWDAAALESGKDTRWKFSMSIGNAATPRYRRSKLRSELRVSAGDGWSATCPIGGAMAPNARGCDGTAALWVALGPSADAPKRQTTRLQSGETIRSIQRKPTRRRRSDKRRQWEPMGISRSRGQGSSAAAWSVTLNDAWRHDAPVPRNGHQSRNIPAKAFRMYRRASRPGVKGQGHFDDSGKKPLVDGLLYWSASGLVTCGLPSRATNGARSDVRTPETRRYFGCIVITSIVLPVWLLSCGCRRGPSAKRCAVCGCRRVSLSKRVSRAVAGGDLPPKGGLRTGAGGGVCQKGCCVRSKTRQKGPTCG